MRFCSLLTLLTSVASYAAEANVVKASTADVDETTFEARGADAESAACYGNNYPDLLYRFCKKQCDVEGLRKHFLNRGRKEGRQFGCEATITAAHKARWERPRRALNHRGAGGAPRCNADDPVAVCTDTQLRILRSAGQRHACRIVRGLCACGDPAGLDSAANLEADVAATAPSHGPRVCAVVRTYAGHAHAIGPALQTMRAAARAAGRGVRLEVHLLNTDAREIGSCFRQHVALEANRSGAADGFAVHEHFDGRRRASAASWRARYGVTMEKYPPITGFKEPDYGYVQTDLTLLDLRHRGGCDFIHVTNGDNVYHVDYFRRHLDAYAAHPAAVSSAVDFWHHGRRKVVQVHYRLTLVDLAALTFRAAYLDKRNATFVVGLFERGGSIPNPRGRLHSADGVLAVDVATDVGAGRAREIHGHGPLLFHF